MLPYGPGELSVGRGLRGMGGDRVDLLDLDFPGAVVAPAAGDLEGLDGVREPQPAGHRGGFQAADLVTAVSPLAGVVAERDLGPRQTFEKGVKLRVVVLDDRDVVRILDLDEEAGVGVLRVQRVEGDRPPGQVQRGRQAGLGPEPPEGSDGDEPAHRRLLRQGHPKGRARAIVSDWTTALSQLSLS
ncbi:hypothetical protein AB5J72_49120 [Streptomyces sp. CG1]|uniref:hypothetical protein n=1 Tax=Streptomyces sp. CG1 TaxID=1287523 RepID=UPI0034E28454